MRMPALSLNLLLQSGKTAAGSAGRHAASGQSPAHNHLLRWLMSLGGLGLFGLAMIDSSVIPIPLPGSTDLLLIWLTSERSATALMAVWLAFCAFSGSMIGGYLAWSVGHKGGEAALARYIPKRFLNRITGWMNSNGSWTLGIVTILPPPVPLMPFVVAAGALGVSRGRFLTFYSVARVLRYGFLAWFGVTYGRRVVRTWLSSLGGWTTTIVWVYVGMTVLGILYGLYKWRKAQKPAKASHSIPAEDVA
jgi:membrane protein YqaA with SNARE-associated domain